MYEKWCPLICSYYNNAICFMLTTLDDGANSNNGGPRRVYFWEVQIQVRATLKLIRLSGKISPFIPDKCLTESQK